jgi:predicted Zn finger-like uncharacterized protein
MIIQCQSCAAKYFLPEEKVPANPLKVRCPKCRAVFMLAPRLERVTVMVAAEAPAPMPAPSYAPPEATVVDVAPPMVEAVRPMDMPPPVVEAVREVEETPPIVETPAAESPRSGRGGKSAEDRAKRLARVLVSDILWYNRERRDAALRDGTLMTSLGEEIKKSWELYKEKVGPEAAHSTNYFKEALNEILANGQQVF